MEGPERLRAQSFSEFIPRQPQDIGQVYNNLHHNHNVQPYPSSNGLNFVSSNHYLQYSTLPPSYSTFSPAFSPTSSSPQNAILYSYSGSHSMPYSLQPPPRSATLPSQQRAFGRNYASSHGQSHHSANRLYLRTPLDYTSLIDTEDQDSINRESGESEPMEPPLEGYPDVNDFDNLMKCYVAQLSPKKQDKALINARRAANIRFVLSNKKTTAVESAQFRFWVKKMFQLQPGLSNIHPDKRKICHENKPIAVREKLFKILTRAHQKCQHGGRDKTSAQVRKVYSWVPKELISRFVKLCPTCRERRGAISTTDGSIDTPNVPASAAHISPNQIRSPLKRFRSPNFGGEKSPDNTKMPPQLLNSSSAFQHQNRWLSDFPHIRSSYDTPYAPSVSFSSHSHLKDLMAGVQSPRATFEAAEHGPQDIGPAPDDTSRLKDEAKYKNE